MFRAMNGTDDLLLVATSEILVTAYNRRRQGPAQDQDLGAGSAAPASRQRHDSRQPFLA